MPSDMNERPPQPPQSPGERPPMPPNGQNMEGHPPARPDMQGQPPENTEENTQGNQDMNEQMQENNEIGNLPQGNQEITGNISVDSLSDVTLNIKENSVFNGAVESEGNVSIYIDDTSKWILQGDSYINELNGNTENIDTNGYTLYINDEKYA